MFISVSVNGRTSVCLGALCHHRHWTCWLPLHYCEEFIYWFRCYDKRRGSKCNPYFTPVNFLSWWNFCILIFTAAVKTFTKLRRDLCLHVFMSVLHFFSTTVHPLDIKLGGGGCIAEDTKKGSPNALGRYLNPRHSDDVGADNSIEDFS